MTHNRSYEDLLLQTYQWGETRSDRTGTGTRSLFAPASLVFDLSDHKVPIIQSKTVAVKMATAEFLWMLSGSTYTGHLRAWSPRMADIWEQWANESGNIGPTYGAQWRNAGGSLTNGGWGVHSNYGVDQLRKLIVQLATLPDTRRAVVSLWSVPELDDMGIEPCMVLFQFSLRGENLDELELHVYQRSADLMLGVPFDLYQAGLLAHLVARELWIATGKNIKATRLVWSAGDVHIYDNQLDAARQQLDQWLKGGKPGVGGMVELNPSRALSILDASFQPDHVTIKEYAPLGHIDAGSPAV